MGQLLEKQASSEMLDGMWSQLVYIDINVHIIGIVTLVLIFTLLSRKPH
jgi:hypothetical protein